MMLPAKLKAQDLSAKSRAGRVQAKSRAGVVFAKITKTSTTSRTVKITTATIIIAMAIAIAAAAIIASGIFSHTAKSAYAAVNERINGIIYTINTENKTASVKAYDLSNDSGFPKDGKVNIPASISCDGIDYQVTSLEDYCFMECGAITSINISDGVTSIGELAFSGCTALESANIPSSVTAMNLRCFQSCSLLKSIVIPDGVSVLGADSFNGCSALTSATLPNSLTTLGYCCFANCDSLSSITIPKTTTTLGESCFANCGSLKEVIFEGNAITQCNRSAFANSPNDRRYVFEKTIARALKGAKALSSTNSYYRVKFFDDTGALLQQIDVQQKYCPYNKIVGPLDVAPSSITGAPFKAWSSNAYKNITNSGVSVVAVYSEHPVANDGRAANNSEHPAGFAASAANVAGLAANGANAAGQNTGQNTAALGQNAAGFAANAAGQNAAQNAGQVGPNWNRLAGGVALKTMQKIVDKGWESSDWAVIATTKGYQDALSACALAGLLDNAPVLMTSPTELSEQTSILLATKDIKHAVIVGGTAAVSESVEAQIKALLGDDNVERIAGGTATTTALEVYSLGKEMGEIGATTWGTDAIVATVDSFQDALSIAPYAYAKHAPIFLTDKGTKDIRSSVQNAIVAGGFNRTLITGGTAAVSALVDAKVPSAKRLAGGSAYSTSKQIANFALSQGMSATNMGVACGTSYQDALVGASLLGKLGCIITLADNKNSTAINSIVAQNKANLGECYIFGGTAAVSQAVENKILAASI